MLAVKDLASHVGMEAACRAFAFNPGYVYRDRARRRGAFYCQTFFRWYNTEHRHSGIALMPPDAVHHGRSTALTAQRGVTLDAAFAAHPTRFKGIAPRPPSVPLAVWINPPKKETSPATITPICSLNS